MAINKVSEETKAKIKGKSAYTLPDNPSASGMKPSDIKKAFYAPILAVLEEIDRVIKEANTDAATKVDKTTTPRCIYGTGPAGNQTFYHVEQSEYHLSKGHLVQRIANGDIRVPPTPTDDTAATSKSYVDSLTPYLIFDSSNNSIAVGVRRKDGSTVLSDYITLPVSGSGPGSGSGSGIKEIALVMSESEYKIKAEVKLTDGSVITSNDIDLPLETMVLNAEVSEDGQSLILTLNNEEQTKVVFGVAKLLSGLASQSYVDGGLAKKVDKSAIATETGNSNDKVMSQKAVTDALAQKVPNLGANPDAGTRVYCWFGNGDRSTLKVNNNNEKNSIPVYSDPSTDYGKASHTTKGCLVTGTPDKEHPYHAANKLYVDSEDSKIESQVRAAERRITFVEQALGEFVVTDIAESWGEGIDVPAGAFPNICINWAEGSGGVIDWDTQEISHRVEFVATKVIFLGENCKELGWNDITTTSFVTMPEGTRYLTFNWRDVDTSSSLELQYNIRITYQALRTGG